MCLLRKFLNKTSRLKFSSFYFKLNKNYTCVFHIIKTTYLQNYEFSLRYNKQ